MENILNLEKLFHRSKDRIKYLGEVFTPEAYVEDMLGMLAKDNSRLWLDENIVFFEPCCGHGNIVIQIYKKRLEGIYQNAISQSVIKAAEAPLFAVANALNTIWAIDIDAQNIANCRSRVFSETICFLKKKLNIDNDLTLLTKKQIFLAHVLSAIRWHITENETLSALSTPEKAASNAKLTKSGSKWYSTHGHVEFDFELSWVNFFESCTKSKVIPLEFKRANKFIDASIAQRFTGFSDFEFAKAVLINSKYPTRIKENKSIEA